MKKYFKQGFMTAAIWNFFIGFQGFKVLVLSSWGLEASGTLWTFKASGALWIFDAPAAPHRYARRCPPFHHYSCKTAVAMEKQKIFSPYIHCIQSINGENWCKTRPLHRNFIKSAAIWSFSQANPAKMRLFSRRWWSFSPPFMKKGSHNGETKNYFYIHSSYQKH